MACGRIAGVRYLLEHADVLKWIARYGDHVGIVARLEHSDPVFPVKQPGAVQQIGFQDIHRFHSVFHHQFQLPGLGAMREGTYIGTHRHGDAVLQLKAELLRMVFQQMAFCPRTGEVRVWWRLTHPSA